MMNDHDFDLVARFKELKGRRTFYLEDFTGEVQIIAYAVQTDGFDQSASASDIWSTTISSKRSYRSISPIPASTEHKWQQ